MNVLIALRAKHLPLQGQYVKINVSFVILVFGPMRLLEMMILMIVPTVLLVNFLVHQD
jgi:hypothetical protein